MKTLTSTILTFILILSINVQSLASPANALRNLRKHYRSIETIHAKFTERFEWAMTGEVVEMEGTMHVGNDNKFRIETEVQLLICEGLNIYRYNKQRNQLIIEPVKGGGADNLLPRKILLDFADEFKAVGMTELPVEGKAGYRLDLDPLKSEEVLLKSASIWATSADNIVHRIRLVDLNGNSTTYSLSEIKINTPITKESITFEISPDMDVFDLR